jgi:hypothetical protein
MSKTESNQTMSQRERHDWAVKAAAARWGK